MAECEETRAIDYPLMHTRHIVLSFNLRDQKNLPRNPTLDEFEVLSGLFPAYSGAAVLGPFLVIYVKELPPKPWPLSVAGLPLFLTTEDFKVPWTIGTAGNVRHSVLDHLDARETSDRSLYEAVISFFRKQNVEIFEVVWFFGCWRVRTFPGADISILPGKMCQATTFYIAGEEPIPIEAAFRQKLPTTTCADDSEYTPIRPGVMVASDNFLTTSGVLVKDSVNETYMTVASHGFPEGHVHVYHPKANCSMIGEVIHHIVDTDIGLMKLQENVVFENRTFQSGLEPDGVFLRGIKDPFELKRFDIISMDSPYTGLIDGQYLTVALKHMPRDAHTEHLWVEQLWQWFGQDASAIPIDGSCGSALLDTDGYVIGFFRYLDADNIGIGAAAQELVRNGYMLCNTSNTRTSKP
uniref:Uncharacterized protein n=1 Tax=Monascus pilosus TaxID=89488 RepID=R9UQT6_MONPI|nr:hypothetical protein 2379 [Monascus pilosus]